MEINIEKIGESYKIQSFSDPSIYYNIRKAVFGNHWVCDCPAFIMKKENIDCKHIFALKGYLEGNKENA